MRKCILRCVSRCSSAIAAGSMALITLAPIHADEKTAADEEDVVVVTVDGAEVEDEESDSKLWLGIQLKKVEGDLARYLGSEDGILIDGVLEGSPAAKAGIETGDILQSVSGNQLENPESLLKFMSELDAENIKPLSLKLLRKGASVELEIVPESRPKSKTLEWKGIGEGNFTIHLTHDDIDESINIKELLEKAGNREINVLRFGNPSLMVDRSKANSGKLNVNVIHNTDGNTLEITVKREEDQPAKIEVKQDGKTSSFTEEELDNLPEEVKVIVAPILEGKRQVRLLVDGEGPAGLAKQLLLFGNDNNVRRDAIEGIRARVRQAAEHAADIPSEIKELKALVEELRAEVEKLRSEAKAE